jgi:hypothetical protein
VPEDRFCANCGRPVQETAAVPTPEADVPVPPPAESTPQSEDRSAPPQAPQTSPGDQIGYQIGAGIVSALRVTTRVGRSSWPWAGSTISPDVSGESPSARGLQLPVGDRRRHRYLPAPSLTIDNALCTELRLSRVLRTSALRSSKTTDAKLSKPTDPPDGAAVGRGSRLSVGRRCTLRPWRPDA